MATTRSKLGLVRTYRRGNLFWDALATVLTLVLAVVFLVPLFWSVGSALKQPAQVRMVPPIWIPNPPQWSNFIEVGQAIPFFLFVRNSFFVTIVGTIGGVVSASLVAYGFAHFRFRGRNVLFIVLLSTMMLPQEVTLIPTYLLFQMLGWLDSYLPLLVPLFFGGGAFSIFLFRQFFATIPKDFSDAAKVDGCGHFRYYWEILMPLSIPVVITDCILYFQFLWNDFMMPLIYLQTTEKLTVSVGLLFLRTSLGAESRRGRPTEHLLMAGAVLAMLPSLIIFFALQRYFVRGVVMSGIKG